jgi:hypothetical protein
LKTSLLPASPKVSVNESQTYKLIQLSLSESQLGIKVISFIGQYLEVTGGSASIAHLRTLRRVLSRNRQLLLVLPELLVLVILNQPIRDPCRASLNLTPERILVMCFASGIFTSVVIPAVSFAQVVSAHVW